MIYCFILFSNRPELTNLALQDIVSLQPVPLAYKLANPNHYEEQDMFVEFRTVNALRAAKKVTGWLKVANESKVLLMPYVTGGHFISDGKKVTQYFNHWKLVVINNK